MRIHGLVFELVTNYSINGRRIGRPSASSCGQVRHNWGSYKPHDRTNLIRIPEAYYSTQYLRNGPVAGIDLWISRYHCVSLHVHGAAKTRVAEEVAYPV